MASELDPVTPMPAEHAPDDLPAVIPQDGEVAVSVQPEGLLVAGDPSEIDAYVERIREAAGHAVGVMGMDKATLGNAAGLAAGAASFLGQTAKFVQLHPESVKAIHQGQLIPGMDGFYRMMTRGADKKFVSQLQWKQANLTPTRMMSLQMVAVQLALKTAIAEVEVSVQRVEGKVEEVLRLAHANRSGDVLGDRITIDRMAAYLDKHGSLSDADWDSIAGIGPALNRTVEQLRHHADRTLRSFDPTKPIQERASFIVNAVDGDQLGETLNLLVVAQESLSSGNGCDWLGSRQLNLNTCSRSSMMPEICWPDSSSRTTPCSSGPGRYWRPLPKLRPSTGSGSGQCRVCSAAFPPFALTSIGSAKLDAHMQDWDAFTAPTALDAASVVVERASETAAAALGVASDTATLALGAASEGIDKIGGLLGRARAKGLAWRRDKSSEVEDT
jgi:hypothetical protein